MQTVKQQPQQQLNVIERISQLFITKLTETPFPMERLSAFWRENAIKALGFTSPGYSRIPHTELASLLEKSYDGELILSYQDFATMQNNLDTVTAEQLGLKHGDYAALLRESITHIEFYDEETKKMKKDCELAIGAEDLAKKERPAGVFTGLKAEA